MELTFLSVSENESFARATVGAFMSQLDPTMDELKNIDEGIRIKNIEEAKTPLYTSKPELERSGMGFTIMDSFMDSLQIDSIIGEGTIVTMKKILTKSNIVCH